MKRSQQAGREEWTAEQALAQLSSREHALVQRMTPASTSEQHKLLSYASYLFSGYGDVAAPIFLIDCIADEMADYNMPFEPNLLYVPHHGSNIRGRPAGSPSPTSEAHILQKQHELESRLARLDALEARVAALESERGIPAPRTPHTKLGTLDWILSHPEFQERYAGQHVAIRESPDFEIISSNTNLGELLDFLGDDLTDIYIHQFL